MSQRARDFWGSIYKDIADAMDRIIPKSATVDSVLAEGVKIIPSGNSGPLGEVYSRLAGPKLFPGDRVATLELGGKSFVLGRIWQGATDTIAYDVPVSLLGGLLLGSSELEVLTGSGSPEGVETAPVGSLYLRSDGGAGTTLYVKQSGAGSSGWVGLASGGGSRAIVIGSNNQDSATDGSNTSTSIYDTGVLDTLTLPDLGGATFSVLANTTGYYYHSSAGNTVRARTEIDNNQGASISIACTNSTGRTPITTSHLKTGVADGQTIDISSVYRPNSTGTASCGGGQITSIAIEE